jgi:hypothetical protein
MNWITEIGYKILNKFGLGPEQPTSTQKAVLEAVEKIEVEPVEIVDEDQIEAAAEIYHFLEGKSAEGTSIEWKRNDLKMRMLKKFPYIKESKLNEIVKGLYAP